MWLKNLVGERSIKMNYTCSGDHGDTSGDEWGRPQKRHACKSVNEFTKLLKKAHTREE